MASSLIWWICETDRIFQLLNRLSVYPYPSLGPSCISALVMAGTLFFLGVVVMVYGPVKARMLDRKVRMGGSVVLL